MPSCTLEDGFNQFSLENPSVSVNTPKPSLLVMPSPPAAPISGTEPASPANHLVEPRLCKTPTPTSTARSPRPRRHRRGPALSLPNLKSLGAQPKGSEKYSTASLSAPNSQSCPTLESSGRGYDGRGPVALLPHLYIGSNVHASKQSILEEHGITAVLNVSRLPNYFPTVFRYMQIPVDDSTEAELLPWFNEATAFIESVERSKGRVLVHCHAGISRSATVCLAYLMNVRRIRLDEAFELVRSVRTVISPNLGFMIQLLRYQEELAVSRKEKPKEHAKESVKENSPRPQCNNTIGSNKYRVATKLPHLEIKTTLQPTPVLTATENGKKPRQLSLCSSPLRIKRMNRSISLPGSQNQSAKPSSSPCTPSKKQHLVFNFDLPVLAGGAHSCALECAELSPAPSPIF